MKRNWKNLLNPRLGYGLLSLGVKGYFEEKGWNRSFIQKESVNIAGDPIPWLSYSFLDFMNGRLKPDFSVFEYGSGNSTLFFAGKLKHVVSVEYDKFWLEKIKNKMPENVDLKFIDLEGDKYEKAILEETKKFEIILIDGRKRIKCLKIVLNHLSDDGVVIFDDTEREKYATAFIFMAENGFKNIPFSGIGTGITTGKITTLFYRENNCFKV